MSEPNVWKVGSRWGFGGPSNLDLFLNYQCAFFGLDAYRIGKWQDAKKGDLLLVCNGSKPVAIGIMQSEFKLYHAPESTIKFCQCDYDEWIEGREDICICKARYCLIPEGEEVPWENDGMKRFCSHTKKDIVIQKWGEYNAKEINGEFEIESRAVSLMERGGMPGIFSRNTRYRIPVYQRPYSWGENELRRLMEDLREAFTHKEPAFMGTVQLSSRMPLWTGKNNERFAFDIVDGQQRTSTFLIIKSLLEERIGKIEKDDRNRQYITHVNQGSAQRYLDAFWKVWNEGKLTTLTSGEAPNNPYISNAYSLNCLIDEYFGDKESNNPASPAICKQLLDFIHSKLRFVIIETKAGLSKTLKIFNTINTTGLDLGTADIFKLRLFEYLKDAKGASDTAFDEIAHLYERVDNHLRENTTGIYYSMYDVLSIYQRILISQYNLRNDLYWYGAPRFFERLFDKLLGIREWPEFSDKCSVELSIADLERVIDCLESYSNEYGKNESLRIARGFIEETRYGESWNYPIIALYFNAIKTEELCPFSTLLFKLLVPPSLYWAKKVYAVQNRLVEILKSMSSADADGCKILGQYFEHGLDNIEASKQVEEACSRPMSGYPKWKNLVCKLCEHLTLSDAHQTTSFEYLFRTSFDIEHIQSYVDKEDREANWKHWGEEINSLGNLVIFESSKNRSVGNDSSKKKDAYETSQYITVNELAPLVGSWKLEQAIERRKRLTARILKYLFSPC